MDQTEQDFLKHLADANLTDEEMQMHTRVYEQCMSFGSVEIEEAMTRATTAVIGQRLYGGKASIQRHLKAGWEAIYAATMQAEADKAAEKAKERAQSLICPPDPNPPGSLIISGRAGIIQH